MPETSSRDYEARALQALERANGDIPRHYDAEIFKAERMAEAAFYTQMALVAATRELAEAISDQQAGAAILHFSRNVEGLIQQVREQGDLLNRNFQNLR